MSGPGSVELGAWRWPEVTGRTAGGRLWLVLPVGSTEQHGPHLPLDTDTRIATHLALMLARVRPDLVVAPALAFGASGEHAGFPGTLSLGQRVLTEVIVELVRSANDFAGVVAVNGHGGNLEALGRAESLLVAEGRRFAAFSPVATGDAHAGRTETSIMLALAPGQVRLDLAVAGERAPLGQLLGRLRAEGVAAVSPNGVLGDPTGATAGEGHSLLRAMASGLEGRVADWIAGLGGQAS